MSGSQWFDDNIEPDISDTIIRLSVSLGNNKTVNRDFRPDVAIDYDMLVKELEDMPARFAFWATVLAEQRAEVSKFDRIIKVRRAAIVHELLEGDASIPKWKVDDLVESDEKLIKIETRLIMAKRTESKLFAIVDALRMKSEHLRSLAGFKRQEMRDA